jgi:CDGSH-type Zn-finger protein/uncharacterized Fe-S cluster protein YjdI
LAGERPYLSGACADFEAARTREVRAASREEKVMTASLALTPSREHVIRALHEAAELEHSVMCTYLYAAFSLKDGAGEGLSGEEAEAVKRWRRTILGVAIDEMSHLAAVWNITAAIGGSPRFGRGNFPLDPGALPAGVVVKLAPFSADVLQHFIHLERPADSDEPDGAGFERGNFKRGAAAGALTPMGIDYETVGEFYGAIEQALGAMAARLGEEALFCGDPRLQLSQAEVGLNGVEVVRCLKTAVAALAAIVTEGEGASEANDNSHFRRFQQIRDEYKALVAQNPAFEPAHPAAINPVLRRPPGLADRVWIEDEESSAVVDAANAVYQTMLRLMAYAYTVRGEEKRFSVDLGIDLMKAMTFLAESAARRPATASWEQNAGMSFTALRDAAPLPQGASAHRFFTERLQELSERVRGFDQIDMRLARAAGLLQALATRAERFAGFTDALVANAAPTASAPTAAPPMQLADGAEVVDGEKLQISYNDKRCIHARFCVTRAPKVFLANVQGPWIHPDDMDAEEVRAVIGECPSGALQYKRKDGGLEEQAPPVNLISVREAGPYAFRSALSIEGKPAGYRATLCRCGASKNKPFCDRSHLEIGFDATGEPPTSDKTSMLAVRGGPLDVTPALNGPLMVRGNLEIISGTGRLVSRTQAARLCRCGYSNTKPFCDDTHAKIGFRSETP